MLLPLLELMTTLQVPQPVLVRLFVDALAQLLGRPSARTFPTQESPPEENQKQNERQVGTSHAPPL